MRARFEQTANQLASGVGNGRLGCVPSRQADALGVPVLDTTALPRFIAAHGYCAYARANVEVYRAITNDQQDGVLALSSGFMTYPPAIHRWYADLRRDIERSTTTFVLLPSLDLETCVVEIVRRQLGRPLRRRTAAREEAVIRDRFGTYLSVPAPKIETMRPPTEVAAEILTRLPTNLALPPEARTKR